jgi:uncharacterized protein YjbI with pentapeptide repeats
MTNNPYHFNNFAELEVEAYLEYCRKGDMRADFSGVDLSAYIFDYMCLKNVCFKGANLTSAFFRETTLTEIDFTEALCDGAYFEDADLEQVCFKRAQLERANLCDTTLWYVDMQEANCSDASFIGALIRDSSFENTNLTNADLTGYTLIRSTLSEAKGIGTQEAEMLFAQTLLEQLETQEAYLNMRAWHSCDTTHCIAGHWDVHQIDGRKASTQIPTLAQYFYATKPKALAALAQIAKGEESIFNMKCCIGL